MYGVVKNITNLRDVLYRAKRSVIKVIDKCLFLDSETTNSLVLYVLEIAIYLIIELLVGRNGKDNYFEIIS